MGGKESHERNKEKERERERERKATDAVYSANTDEMVKNKDLVEAQKLSLAEKR